jgi:hypothetical protein
MQEIIEEEDHPFTFTESKSFPHISVTFLQSIGPLTRKDFVNSIFFKIFDEGDIINKTVKTGTKSGKMKKLTTLDQRKKDFIIGE